ncbi:MAG: histidinol-phosphatase [Armatimonadetes bacterium]|nr:histidinol-phosphatase [Armatimonadota bacterium]
MPVKSSFVQKVLCHNIAMSPRLIQALEIATIAGRSTLSLFQNQPEIEIKSDETPVTLADKRAEEIARKEIEKRFPGEAVLGEEQGMSGAGDDRWVIDPIDGTKSFIAGVPLYSTLLSYEQAGQPILGVVYFPALDELYYAELGGGAFCNGRQIHVQDVAVFKNSIICCGSHAGMKKNGYQEGLDQIAVDAMATRTWCDAYGHMLVAGGRVAAMLDPTVSRWDISSVIPIIREAGGVAMSFSGNEPLADPESPKYNLISTSPGIKDALLEQFAK